MRIVCALIVVGAARAAADPAPSPAPSPDRCHADLAEITPPGVRHAVTFLDGRRARSVDYRMCDTPARVVLFRATAGRTTTTDRDATSRMRGDVIVIDRARVDRPRRASLADGSECVDHCGGRYGGHAGCSETSGCTLFTPITGARAIRDFPEDRSIVGDDGSTASCGPEMRGAAFATCSTLGRFAIVEATGCGPKSEQLRVHVYEHDTARAVFDEDQAATLSADGDLDDGSPDGDVWAYRFPADQPGGRDVVLRYALGATPWASLEVGGTTEPCFAWSLASGAP